MKQNIWRWYAVYGIAVVFACAVVGCRKDQEKDVPAAETAEAESISFSVKKYQKKLSADRIPISEYGEKYKDETQSVRAMEYKNLDFADCDFQEFPDMNHVELLVAEEHGISVEESWDTIEQWLADIGREESVDMEKEVRVVSPQLGLDANGDYFLFYEYMDELETGVGAHIMSNLCHIQITENGIYSMSNGKITEYLGENSGAINDAMGEYAENVVEAGPLSELQDKKYQVIDGEMTVGEGAEIVKSYFSKGTPFACEEGVEVDVPEASVFRLGDVYGFDYMVRRVYDNLPFAYMDHGNYQLYDGNLVSADIKHAYVADSSGVAAYAGYNEAERLKSLIAENNILGLEKSMEIMSKKMAPQMDVAVKSVGLVYLPMEFENSKNPEERVIFPCWQVEGTNKTKGEGIKIYLDVLTSDIYYCMWEEG